MLKCGRRCCLCHLPAGGKMEIHHIVQRADGGDESIENGIPLCFNCHAEVGHYNVEHPKGTKFTSKELRGHRDRWFETYAGLKSASVDGNQHRVDRRVAIELHELMTGSGMYFAFRDDQSWYGFNLDVAENWRRVVEALRLPDMKFLDPELEHRRIEIHEKLQAAYDRFQQHSCYWETTERVRMKPLFYVPDAFEEEFKVSRELDEELTHVVELYEELFGELRVKLELDLRFG